MMSSLNPSTSRNSPITNGTVLAKGTNAVSSTVGTSNDSFAPAATQASKAWRDFEETLKTLTQHSQIFSTMMETMDEQTALKTKVQQKDLRIGKLESSIETQAEQTAKHWQKWDKEKIELEHQLSQVRSQGELKVKDVETSLMAKARDSSEKQNSSHAREIRELKKELNTEKKKAAAQTDELEKANAKAKKVELELGHHVNRLKEWESCISLLKPLDLKSFEGKLKQCFVRCCTIIREHFLQDLPELLFEDRDRWVELPRFLNVPLNFPPTNTPVAKNIRVAAALHVVARRITTDVFRPCCIPKSIETSEAIKDILVDQFETDKKKERITRALLQSTYTSQEVELFMKQAVDITSKDIAELLNPIGANEAFRKDIEQLLHDIAGVWKEAQQSMKMVEASMTDDDYEEWQWAHLDEFNSTVPQLKTVIPKFHMLTLFPRVYVPEDGSCVFSGYVLRPTDNVVVAAEHEYYQWVASKKFKSGRAGGPSGVPRRLSVRNDEGNGLKPGERQAFLEKQRLRQVGSNTQNGNRGEG